jgi:5-(carboxyamino)imidazole ribonucleotide mutase
MAKKVAIIMGSDSDLPVVQDAAKELKKFGVEFEIHVMSAHRTPEAAADFAKNAADNGFGVIIAAAGMAAALPGVVASQTVLPVIGVPLSGSVLDGTDALYSIVQMPPGIPVATVAINGGKNAAWLALQIIGISHPEIREKLLAQRVQMEEDAMKANEEVIAKFEA